MTIKKEIGLLLKWHKIDLISYKNSRGENGYRWVFVSVYKDGKMAEFQEGYWEASKRIAFDRIEKSIKDHFKL